MPRITKDYFVEKIGSKFPSETVDFVYDIFNKNNFSLKVSRPRASKKGDFRYNLQGKTPPLITINSDLCSYEFLLVFLHEVAHYRVFVNYKIQDVKSHGSEWKCEYLTLLQELMDGCALPDDITQAFVKHARNIKSSSAIDQDLENAFNNYRDVNENVTTLNKLAPGDTFIARNDLFILNKFLRTRALCTNLCNNRKYSIHGMAPVIKVKD